MKHLFTSVAIAAALAISAPAWAQKSPMKPAAAPPKPAAAAPAKPAAGKPMAGKSMAKRHVVRHHRMMAREDSTTEQLNQQELARIQGGGGAGGPAPDRMQGPKAGPK